MLENIVKYEKNETESEEKMKEEEVKYYDQIIENIEAGFTSDNYDTSNLDKGEDEVIETEKMTVTFTTTQNQKDNTNNNMSSIDLGECEILLRKYYNISDNETLYMKKVDIIQEGVKTAKIEYDVYCKLKGNKLEKLNISTICGDSKILLSIPMELSDDIDKLNTSSDYYNDICYVATSESGTDISLKDRKKEYIEGNKVVCQEDCDFSEYDSTTQKAKCSCQVKESSTSFADMTINTTKLYENFADFKNIINFNILVCYKILFTKLGLLRNIGSYIIAVIIIFHIICIIIFYMKQLRTIFKKIKDIIFGIKFFKLLKKANKKLKKKKKENIIETRRNDGEDKNNEIILIQDKKNKKGKKGRNKKKIEYDNDEFINNNTNNINTININNIHLNKKKKNKKIKIIKKRKQKKSRKQKKIEKVKKIMQYTDEEINMLPFEIAILYDKRNYCQYYISLLKTKHNFLFSFFNNNDYNSKIIKIDLFGIGFTLYYTVNALFYNDDTMHNIYTKMRVHLI